MPLKVSIIQSILSYLYPIKIRTIKGITYPEIYLYRYFGRWQLATNNVLYSDGNNYVPLRVAFNTLKKNAFKVQNMLVLGSGIGSILDILHTKKISIHSTLVEIEHEIIHIAKQLFKPDFYPHYQWVCQDAQNFILQNNKKTYDLIVIDLFIDNIVPAFISNEDFIFSCSQLLSNNADSVCVLNYIINQPEEWNKVLAILNKFFIVEKIIKIGLNRILILRKIV